jgi:hypothetical protein
MESLHVEGNKLENHKIISDVEKAFGKINIPS